MALINMGTADGSTLGNPSAGEFYLFLDSNNGSQLTRRNSSGTDLVYSIGDGIDALGWIAVTDTTYTSGSPLNLTASTDTLLDFHVDTVEETYPPNGYTNTDFFNETTSRITSPITGAGYVFRFTFDITPQQSNRTIDVTFSTGVDISNQVVIDKRSTGLISNGGTNFISSTSFFFATGTFITNGMQIILNCTTNAAISNIQMVLSRVN